MKPLNTPQLQSWFKNQQKQSGLKTHILQNGLSNDWQLHENHPYPLHRPDHKFHRAVAIEAEPIDSNKNPWQQFMVEMMDTQEYEGLPINGIILLVKTKVDGQAAYLVQAKTEPGAIHQKNNLFLTTSIQASFSNSQMNPGKIPLWDKLTTNLNSKKTQLKTPPAPSLEDPGIFYGKHNLLALREMSQKEAEAIALPKNYTWANREAIRHFQQTGEAAQFVAQVLGTFE